MTMETQPRPDNFETLRATITELLRQKKATVDEVTDVTALEIRKWEDAEYVREDLDCAYYDIKGVEGWLEDNTDALHTYALILRAHGRVRDYDYVMRAYEALGSALGELSEVV
jgi:uncharacterized protein YydD (DUF2326 family)